MGLCTNCFNHVFFGLQSASSAFFRLVGFRGDEPSPLGVCSNSERWEVALQRGEFARIVLSDGKCVKRKSLETKQHCTVCRVLHTLQISRARCSFLRCMRLEVKYYLIRLSR